MWALIRRAFCHHDYSIASEPGLMFLRCRNCEHRTTGWTIDRTVHPESGPHLHRTLQLIKKQGKRAGVALNPATPASAVDHVLSDLDLILVMSVNPGFGGQGFIESQLAKVKALHERIHASGRAIELEIDGGIVPETARKAREAGADVLVAGTAVFKGGASAYELNIKNLRA